MYDKKHSEDFVLRNLWNILLMTRTETNSELAEINS